MSEEKIWSDLRIAEVFMEIASEGGEVTASDIMDLIKAIRDEYEDRIEMLEGKEKALMLAFAKDSAELEDYKKTRPLCTNAWNQIDNAIARFERTERNG